MKSQVNEGTHKPPRKTGIKPVAAKPLKKKLTEAVSAKALANSFSRINVKVLKEPQNGNKPQTFEVNRNQKSVSTKVVVSKQNPQQKRPHEGSNSSIALLKPKTKSRKTKHQKKNEEVVLDKTDSRQTSSALRRFSVRCHCPDCLPCSEECCENQAVRSGRCCDPETLGQCLQPFQPQCYAPCCVPGHVLLRDGLDYINGNVVNKKDVLKEGESEKMRVHRLLRSNISEEVDGAVSTYILAANDHEIFENDCEVEEVDVYTWEDENWNEVLAAEIVSEDDFYSLDTQESDETGLLTKPKDGEAFTSETNDEKGDEETSFSSKTVSLPKKCRDEVVERCPSAGHNISITVKVSNDYSHDSRQIQSQDKCLPKLPSKKVKTSAPKSNQGQARCQPCNLEFPVKDIKTHLTSNHNHEKTKLKSCVVCKDNVFMTAHHLRKHRDLVHGVHRAARGEKPKGRPRKNPTLTSTPRPVSQK